MNIIKIIITVINYNLIIFKSEFITKTFYLVVKK